MPDGRVFALRRWMRSESRVADSGIGTPHDVPVTRAQIRLGSILLGMDQRI